jgi:hypothetical protein
MKKISKILTVCLLSFITLNSFAQFQQPSISSLLPAGSAPHTSLGAIEEPSTSVFSYLPAGYNNAYFSTPSIKCYQSFSGATGSFRMIAIWGVTVPATDYYETFTVEIYSAGATPNTLVYSTTVNVRPEPTGELLVDTYPIKVYNIPIGECSLTSGWISVQATSANSNAFYWLNTFATPIHKAFQYSSDIEIAHGCGLAMSLHNTSTVPVPFLTIILGFALIASVVTFRFWRRMI